MFEGRALLAVGVGNVGSRAPAIQQKDLPAYLRRHPTDFRDVSLLHGKDQIGLAQQCVIGLPGAVSRAIHTVFTQQLQRGRIHRVANECAEAGAAHLGAMIATEAMP